MFNSFVIGNGFSINIVKLLEKKKLLNEGVIDLKNLFSLGDVVPCPDGTIGYLSPQYCPNLWKYGARSFIDSNISAQIISNIICSYNVAQLMSKHGQKSKETSPVESYYELNKYLRNLFIYYNNLITDDMLTSIVEEVQILNQITNDDVIISYNYDILIERLLSIKLQAPIKINNAIKTVGTIKIIKPHGSIDFALHINTIKENNLYNYPASHIIIDDIHSERISQDAALIIPPLGSIIGNNGSWVETIRASVKKHLISSPTSVTFYGLSYDVVDRPEINEIISFINPNARVVYVNPSPSLELDFIFSHHFRLYKQKRKD